MRQTPDNLLALVATSGADNLNEAFEASSIGHIWREQSVQDFYQKVKAQAVARMHEQMSGQEQENFEIVTELLKQLSLRPIIAGAAELPPTGPATEVPVYGFVKIDAGDRRESVAAALKKVEALAAPGEIVEIEISSMTFHRTADDEVPITWGWVGNWLTIMINDTAAHTITHRRIPGGGGKISDHVMRISDIAGYGDALALYFNFQRIAGIVEKVAPPQEAADALGIAGTVIETLGLTKVESLAARFGFSGRDIVADALLSVPPPFTGLLANIVRPVDLAHLDAVPGRASSTDLINIDWAGIYDTVMGAIESAAPQMLGDINKGLARMEAELEFNIRGDLLGSIDGPLMTFTMPPGADVPFGGTAFKAWLTDPVAMEATLFQIGRILSRESNGQLLISDLQHGDHTIHFWGVPMLAMMKLQPCWSIVNNQLIFASNLQMCKLTIKQLSGHVIESVRETKGFKSVTVGLPSNLFTFSYTDYKTEAQTTMQELAGFYPMLGLPLQQQGFTLPPSLPPVGDITKHLGPGTDYNWHDETGVRSHSQGPMMSGGVAVLAAGGLGGAILLPSFGQARDLSRRAADASQLQQLSVACMMFANNNDDQFPPSLQALVDSQLTDAAMIDSPLKPKHFDGSSYIYITGQTTNDDIRNILAYGNTAYQRSGTNVLFLDGHVKWMRAQEFIQALDQTHQRLGREIPDVHFKGGRRIRPAASQPAEPPFF